MKIRLLFSSVEMGGDDNDGNDDNGDIDGEFDFFLSRKAETPPDLFAL